MKKEKSGEKDGEIVGIMGTHFSDGPSKSERRACLTGKRRPLSTDNKNFL